MKINVNGEGVGEKGSLKNKGTLLDKKMNFIIPHHFKTNSQIIFVFSVIRRVNST